MTNKTQVQNEFEATSFMHEVNEAWLLREAVAKYNNNQTMDKKQRQLLAKKIWS